MITVFCCLLCFLCKRFCVSHLCRVLRSCHVRQYSKAKFICFFLFNQSKPVFHDLPTQNNLLWILAFRNLIFLEVNAFHCNSEKMFGLNLLFLPAQKGGHCRWNFFSFYLQFFYCCWWGRRFLKTLRRLRTIVWRHDRVSNIKMCVVWVGYLSVFDVRFWWCWDYIIWKVWKTLLPLTL